MQQFNLASSSSFNFLDHDNLFNGNRNPALNQNDILVGTDNADTLAGGRGTDWLLGGAGNDRLYGGDGSDSIEGEDGADRLYGNNGDDWLDGGRGNDHLFGWDGDDYLVGDSGDDVLYGNTGNDYLSGGAGQDQLDGDPGDDVLDGGRGHDILSGGRGRDVFSWKSDDYDGTDQVLDFKLGEDVLLLAGLLPEGGDSEPALSRMMLYAENPSNTWLVIYQADCQQETHRIHLVNTNLLADGHSDDQVLRQLFEQNTLQLL